MCTWSIFCLKAPQCHILWYSYRRPTMFFQVFFFPSLKVVHVKDLAEQNRTEQQKLLSTTENTAIEMLTIGPAFTAVTLWHHSASPSRTFDNKCMAATLALENWFNTAAVLFIAVVGQACLSWPIRAGWLSGRASLNETGLKQSIYFRGGLKSGGSGQYERSDVISEH